MYRSDEVIAVLKELVEEYGADHVYSFRDAGCTYGEPRDHTQASCIVGHVLKRLEPDVFDLVVEAEATAIMSEQVLDIESKWDIDLPFTPLALCVLSAAQKLQDATLTWGESVEQAIEWAEEHGHTHSDTPREEQ